MHSDAHEKRVKAHGSDVPYAQRRRYLNRRSADLLKVLKRSEVYEDVRSFLEKCEQEKLPNRDINKVQAMLLVMAHVVYTGFTW